MRKQQPRVMLGRIGYAIDPRTSWLGYLSVSGLALAFGIALLDPSASWGLRFPARLAFWLTHAALALFILECVQMFLGRLRLAVFLSPLLIVILGGILGALVFSALSLLALEPFIYVSDLDIAGDDVTFLEFLDEVRTGGGQVVLFWVILNAPRLLMMPSEQDLEHSSAQTDSEDHDSRGDSNLSADLFELLRKLPRELGADIVALSAELHYLRVYTTRGDVLILMPLSRAVSGAQIIPGILVHRSHWVAIRHIAAVKNQEGGIFCQLTTGLMVPVSRKNRSKLRSILGAMDIKSAMDAARDLTFVPDGSGGSMTCPRSYVGD